MAGSVIGKLYIDPLLSGFAVTYRPTGLIAMDALPVVRVPKQSGIYPILEQADQFRIPDTSRSPGTEAKLARFRVGSGNYHARNYALKTNITVEDLENADPQYRTMLEQGRVGTVLNQLGLDLEARAAAIFFSTGNVGSSAAVASAWNVAAGGGSPFTDLTTAIDNVRDATGYAPNQLIFGVNAWNSFRRHDEIVNKTNRTAVTGAAPMASIEGVRELFEMDRVLVGRAYKNTAQENKAMSLVPVWSDHVWVGYQKPNILSMEDPTYASAFRWTVAGVPDMQVERHEWDPRLKSQELEVGYYQAEHVTVPALGFLVTAVNG